MLLTAELCLLPTALGTLPSVAALLPTRAFARRAARPAPATRAGCTILKPICGNEPLLEEALTSFCTQWHENYQLIIGAHHESDPALAVARRVRARFPFRDITIVVNPALHGANRKISNLINMLPAAKHDLLVIADSDLHVRPDYLNRVADALNQPGIGLVTTVCVSEPAVPGLAALLGGLHISHCFLPSALLAGYFRDQDCLGGTMALRRTTLARIGGLEALVGHLADDNVLGRLVQGLGLAVAVAPTLPVVSVQEREVSSLWQHELRWARTIRALAPACYAGTLLQYPLAWALLAVLLTGASASAVWAFLLAWALRSATVVTTERLLRHIRARPGAVPRIWLLPLRDVLSVAQVVASFTGNAVTWRGHTMVADGGVPAPAARAEPMDALQLARFGSTP